jgi:uncharacterized protein (DUF305 family)
LVLLLVPLPAAADTGADGGRQQVLASPTGAALAGALRLPDTARYQKEPEMTIRGLTLWAAAVSVMVLSACGGQDSATTPPAPPFNQADVDYAVDMSMHHSQGVTMADLAATQAGSSRVKVLAERIRQAQATEVDRIAGWLNDWQSKGATMPPHGHSDEAPDVPGMMSDEEMAKLERAIGREFDRLFLSMMIRHHEGAIQLVQQEAAQGASAEAKRVARNVSTAQSREILEMKQLLAQL